MQTSFERIYLEHFNKDTEGEKRKEGRKKYINIQIFYCANEIFLLENKQSQVEMKFKTQNKNILLTILETIFFSFHKQKIAELNIDACK